MVGVVNSIKKGKGFERLVANSLTKLTGVKWQRVPMSGAFSTVNKSTDERFFGDVFTEAPEYVGIVVECKKTKDPITIGELVNPKSRITEWIAQTTKESKTKDWILVFSWNNSKVYFLTPKEEVVTKLKFKSTCIKTGNFFFGLFK